MGMNHDTPLHGGLRTLRGVCSWPRMLLMRRSYTLVVVIWIAELIGLYALQHYFS